MYLGYSIVGKIAIGTAQFSNEYGITNNLKIGLKEINDIINLCKEFKIDTIDTAVDYKNVEEKIGLSNLNYFKIISKLSIKKKKKLLTFNDIENSIDKSLRNLNKKSLYALLIRNPTDILENNSLISKLNRLKASGAVKKIGFTLYNPEELNKLYSFYKPDIVQIPYNIVDSRFEESGWIDKLFNNHIEIHVRSIFLQGVLITDVNNLPNYFLKYKSYFKAFDNWVKQNKTSKLKVCLSHSLTDKRISKVVIGINSLKNLKDIIKIKSLEKINYPNWLKNFDKELIIPSEWKL